MKTPSSVLSMALSVAFVTTSFAAMQQSQQAPPASQAPAPVVPMPHQAAPVIRQNAPAVIPRQQPVTPPLKPSGVLNVPSGVLNVPSGTLFVPPGAVGTLPGETHAARQNFVGGQRQFHQFHHDGDSAHRGSHRRRTSLIVVYVDGAPYWYPVDTAYPYYYNAPLAPTYDSGYSDNSGYVPMVDDNSGGSGQDQGNSNYADVGREWAQDLRREVATWDQFVDYLRNYIVGAPPAAQADFREAFIDSYGVNGAAAYDKGASQAAKLTSPPSKISGMLSAD